MKNGAKTTEFYITIANLVLIHLCNVLDFPLPQETIYSLTAVTMGYIVSRTVVKNTDIKSDTSTTTTEKILVEQKPAQGQNQYRSSSCVESAKA